MGIHVTIDMALPVKEPNRQKLERGTERLLHSFFQNPVPADTDLLLSNPSPYPLLSPYLLTNTSLFLLLFSHLQNLKAIQMLFVLDFFVVNIQAARSPENS